jgi:hypothetical protein
LARRSSRGTRGAVDRRSDNATAVNVEIDSQRRCVGRSQTHFVLEANVECHGLGKRNKLYVRHGPLATALEAYRSKRDLIQE